MERLPPHGFHFIFVVVVVVVLNRYRAFGNSWLRVVIGCIFRPREGSIVGHSPVPGLLEMAWRYTTATHGTQLQKQKNIREYKI